MSTKSLNTQNVDVIIVGAGLVGLTLACALVKNDIFVALVDQEIIDHKTFEDEKFQLRVSAINHASKNIFHNLEVWNKIPPHRLSAFEKMQVWDSLGQGKIEFDCTSQAKSNLGYIIENDVLHNALLTELKKFSSCVFLPASRIDFLNKTSHGIELILQSKMALSARLIVGADGANSWVRKQVGISHHEWSYNHHALVATVETELEHQRTAWQCFLPKGPLALLPLSSPKHCSIVWSSSPNEIDQMIALSDDDFNEKITSAFEYRLGKIKKVSKSITFPLYMRHAKNYIKPSIALVGDAAHTIHPLAGQGINLGFLDAVALAQVIISAKKKNKNIGDAGVLRRYERERKSENWLMVLGMEFFKQLFQSESSLLIKARSLGLNGINHLPLLKNHFIDYALGLKGELPELAMSPIE